MRVLSHPRQGRYPGPDRPEPGHRLPRGAGKGHQSRHGRGDRPPADPPSAPQQRDAGRARGGPGGEGRGRLRRLRGEPARRGPGALAKAGLAEATTGEQIFTAAGCAGCHKLTKAGANGNIGPSLDDLANSPDIKGSPEDYVKESILDPNKVVVSGFQPNVMPVFQGKLTDKQVQALVQYLLGN